MNTIEQLETAGLTMAAKVLKETSERSIKLNKAYASYEFVRQEAVDAYNKKLRDDSFKQTGTKGRDLEYRYISVGFHPLETYDKVPPAEAVEKIIEARKTGIFDYFEVAKIDSVVEYKDPIVFGRIKGCGDRFLVCQWDNDIKFEDLIKADPQTI